MSICCILNNCCFKKAEMPDTVYCGHALLVNSDHKRRPPKVLVMTSVGYGFIFISYV